MFIDDLIADFHNIILKHKVLIFVNYDIDAICAVKILLSVLKHDCTEYTLIPVSTIGELKDAYDEHRNGIEYVILINCGGTIDLVELLEPARNVVFFVADSHRPIDLNNIYGNERQVRLLSKADEKDNIPAYEDFFRDEDDEVVPLQEKDRDRILFEYMLFSYYGKSSAVTMFDLSWKLHKDNIDVLWWCIIGVVEQFVLNKVDMEQYLSEVEVLSAHIGRISRLSSSHTSPNDSSINASQPSRSTTSLRINCEKDLQLALYRHWTIQSSMKYTMLTAVALRMWKPKGEERLQRLLARIGLPIAASQQHFMSMDLSLRQEFHSMMDKVSDYKNLTHIIYPSFTRSNFFGTKYQAADYVNLLLALLLDGTRGGSQRDCFFNALDALSGVKKDLLNDGIEKSKKFLMEIFKQVQNALNMKRVTTDGPFYYIELEQDNVSAKYFSNPDSLWLLATFTLQAYVANTCKMSATSKPLVASAPLEDDYCLVVGVPPLTEITPRSFFGQAFEQAGQNLQCNVFNDYFNPAVVRIAVADRANILHELGSILS